MRVALKIPLDYLCACWDKILKLVFGHVYGQNLQAKANWIYQRAVEIIEECVKTRSFHEILVAPL